MKEAHVRGHKGASLVREDQLASKNATVPADPIAISDEVTIRVSGHHISWSSSNPTH